MTTKLSAIISIPRKELQELYRSSGVEEQDALLQLFGKSTFTDTKDMELERLIELYTKLAKNPTKESMLLMAVLRRVYGEFLGKLTVQQNLEPIQETT